MIIARFQNNEAAISSKDNLGPKYDACLARPFNFNNLNYNPFTHCEDCGMEIEKQWKNDHLKICGMEVDTSHINISKNRDTSDIYTAPTNIAYFSEPDSARQLPQQPNFNIPKPLVDTTLPETINLISLESPPSSPGDRLQPSHKNSDLPQTPSLNLGPKRTVSQEPESEDEMSEKSTTPEILNSPEAFTSSLDSDPESEYIKTPLGYWREEKPSVSR